MIFNSFGNDSDFTVSLLNGHTTSLNDSDFTVSLLNGHTISLNDSDFTVSLLNGHTISLRDDVLDFALPFVSTPKFDDDTKTYVYSTGTTINCSEVKNKRITNGTAIMPEIEDVETIRDDKERTKGVIVKFVDGTSEKAILSDGDTFDWEQGVSICITKKLLSMKSDGNGSAVYNKIIEHAFKIKDKNIKAKNKRIEDEAREKARLKKIAEKRAKRKAQRREQQIEMYAEAYRRAMNSK